jgi:hypothetical protein
MNRSVVSHHWTAWWRSRRATSRRTTGKACRRWSGRGGKGGAGTTAPFLPVWLVLRQPHQEAVGQHDCERVPVERLPQATLVLIPPQLPLDFLMELLDRIAPMRIAGLFLQLRHGRQMAPVVCALLRLAARAGQPRSSGYRCRRRRRPHSDGTHPRREPHPARPTPSRAWFES